MAACVGPSAAMVRTVRRKVKPVHRMPRTSTAAKERTVTVIPVVPVTSGAGTLSTAAAVNCAAASGSAPAPVGMSLRPM